VVGSPQNRALAEQRVLARIKVLAVGVYLLSVAMIASGAAIDASYGEGSKLVPILIAAVAAVLVGLVTLFAYEFARVSIVRLREAESARAEAEQELKDVRGNEQALLNAAIAPAALVDMHGNIMAVNDRTASLLGTTPEALVDKSISELGALEVPVSFKDLRDTVASDKKMIQYVITHQGKHYRHTVSPVFDDSGEVVRMAILSLDVTEEVDMRKMVEESEEKYRNLFESSFDGIVYADSSGTILDCNQSFAEMLGYDSDELLGLSLWDITPREWHSVDREVIENQLLKSGHSDLYEKQYLRKDGSVIPISLMSWTVTDDAGEVLGTWARVEDISEKKQYEVFIRQTIGRLEQANESLREMDRLKTEFVGIVSHELRSPIAAVESGLVALKALGDEATAQQRNDLIGIVERGMHRLGNLVDDLLDITRIESGQLKLELRPVDAVELAGRVMELYQPRFQAKGIELELKHTDSAQKVLCDSRRIEQVLTNLLDNALKFTPEGAVIIRIDGTPSRVICTVTDSGPGIPPSIHQQVFDKFFSVGSPDGNQGVGLGLAISRGIVEAHGGRMWVESRKGSGATFGFELPQDSPIS